MTTLIALLHGPDQSGLVARVSGWIFARGGNILHADQHRDREAGIFFQRIEWQPVGGERAAQREADDFAAFAASIAMKSLVTVSTERPRVAIFVSKAAHCFHDLALRWSAGEFAGELALVISNHRDLEKAARGYGLPFHYVPFVPRSKRGAEGKQLKLLKREKIGLVVLARYMQVLSAGFLRELATPVINIHHSFLPAFAGGKPYHQAHARGVKLIGATAHYATQVLDEGPIIAQDVARVTHRHGVDDLVRMGRDLEQRVLAQAVRSHLEARVLAYGNKTVVFD